MLEALKQPAGEVEIALVGKYMRLRDSYKSVFEALDHAGMALRIKVLTRIVEAEDIEKKGAEKLLAGIDGLLVPGGFGSRGIDGKIAAIRYAREKQVPFLGLCLGMQCASIEFARNVLGWNKANSTEFDKSTPYPVISLLAEQEGVQYVGGSMRLGAYPCALKTGTKTWEAYDRAAAISERHRHRYEFNNKYRAEFEQRGFLISGASPDGNLVEMVELATHPWFVATQAHPEFKSRPTEAHPLFRAFIAAAYERKSRQTADSLLKAKEPAGG